MRCPICEGKTIVIETRDSPTFGIRRRRKCENKHYFTTQEKIIPKEDLDAERRLHQENFKKRVVAVRPSGRKDS